MRNITAVVLLFASASLLYSQQFARPFNFSIPPLQKFSSPLVPVQNPIAPAGQNGWIQSKNGHFEFPDGSQARFFGVSLYYSACFPDSVSAIAMAKHFRELGCNAVRFYGFDFYNWNDASFLAPGNNSNTLDPNQMKRFDWFIYQLKINGVYSFLNMHAGWRPRTGDGIYLADSMPSGGRIVSMTESKFRQKLKEIWGQFFSHINPYTKNAIANEPAISFISLSAENSLVNYWINNYLHARQSGILSYYHRRQLDTLFNNFLRTKYGTTAKLQQSWNTLPSSVDNLANDAGFENMFSAAWQFSQNGNSQVQALFEHSNCEKYAGTISAHARIGRRGASHTDFRLYNLSKDVKKFTLYQLKFFAKSTVPTTISFSAPGSSTVTQQISGNWKEYSLSYRSSDDFIGNARIYFNVGLADGDVYFDEVTLTEQAEAGLAVNEKLENLSVVRAKYDETISRKRMEDNVEFLTDLQKNYYDDLYQFLKNDIGAKQLIAGGTQVTRLNDLYSMENMDFTSEWEGWDYNRGSSNNWYIANTPMVMSTSGGVVPNFSRAKLQNKPLVASNFSMPFPSAHLYEMTTLMPAYAAYMNADAYFLGYYSGNRNTTNLSREYVDERNYNEFKSVPSVIGAIPTAAAVFRSGKISPANKTIRLQQTRDAMLYPQYLQRGTYWLESSTDSRISLFRNVVVDSLNAKIQSNRPHLSVAELSGTAVDTRNLISDTEELLWNADEKIFTVHTPNYLVAAGSLSNKIISIGNARLERLDAANYGMISILSLTENSLDQTNLSLLTVAARAANGGSVWQGDTTTVSNWGTGKTEMEAATVRLSLPISADSVYIYPLDSTGKRLSQKITATKLGNGKFSFEIDQSKLPTIWFHIVSKKGISGAPDDNSDAAIFVPAPNPTSEAIKIIVGLPDNNQPAEIIMTTMQGRSMTVWNGVGHGGIEHISISTHDVPSGLYSLELRCGTESTKTTVAVVK